VTSAIFKLFSQQEAIPKQAFAMDASPKNAECRLRRRTLDFPTP